MQTGREFSVWATIEIALCADITQNIELKGLSGKASGRRWGRRRKLEGGQDLDGEQGAGG